MSAGLDNLRDLDNALNKSLDEIMRENKSARGGGPRRMGRGRGRGGRGGGGRGGRGGRGGGGRGRADRSMRGNNSGRLVNRNRYTAQRQYNNNRNNMRNNDNDMRTMERQRSNGERSSGSGNGGGGGRGRGGRGRGGGGMMNRGRARRPGMGAISSRNMKPSFRGPGRFNNTNNNNRLSRNPGMKRNILPREVRQRLSPLRRNITTSGSVIVQGLLPHVTSDDIKEIFGTIGVVMKAYVKYDGQTGKSTGEAEIVYSHRNDARRAQREMNGRLIDQAPITVRLKNQSPLIRSRPRSVRGGTPRRGGGNPRPRRQG